MKQSFTVIAIFCLEKNYATRGSAWKELAYIIFCQLGKLCYIETTLQQLCILTFLIFTLSDLWTYKKKYSFHNKHIYIYMGHRHFEILWSFILYILERFVLSLKNTHYAYIPPHMHKALTKHKTLGNEKEQQQIKFYEKSSGKLIFSQTTKNLKMFYFTHPTGRVLKK